MTKPRQSYFVGVKRLDGRREVFAVRGDFKSATYRKRYMLVVGPFANSRAAHFVARYGGNAPTFRCAGKPEKVCHGKPLSPRKRIEIQVQGGSQHRAGERPYDLIDKVLDNVGGVPRKPRGMIGETDTLFAGYDAAARAGVLALLPSVKSRPDQVAQVVGYESAEDLWNDLASAAKARKGERAGQRTAKSLLDEAGDQAEAFAKRASCSLQFGATGRPVRAGSLKPGDKFRVDGEPFVVQSFDPSTGQVIAKDGTKFGLQALPATMKLCADPGSVKRIKQIRPVSDLYPF